jgi:hypothetical protein
MSIEIFKGMLGKVMNDVSSSGDEMIFKSNDGKTFKFLHYQDCCENVSIEDICGDLSDLVGLPLLVAEEVSNPDIFDHDDGENESCTWTFYKFATVKGNVTVRWLGTSNGYYSESVSYEES